MSFHIRETSITSLPTYTEKMIPLYDVLLVVAIAGGIFVAPFTKVEESFNIQAIHDIIHHGMDLQAYDHLEFSGAVPRTFVGSLVIAAFTKALLRWFPPAGSKLDGQLVARAVLGIINAFGILALKNAVVSHIKENAKQPVEPERAEKKKKTTIKGKKKVVKAEGPHNAWSLSLWFAILTFTQFHLTYYSSRTLPNFLALPLTNWAFARLVRGRYGSALAIFAATAVLFRVEIVALLLSVGFALYLYKKQTIWDLAKYSTIGGIIGAGLSLSIDSWFWQRLTIPELESFVFNVIEGKSSEWGTEPFTKYFSKYLLTLFLPPIVPALSLIGFVFDVTGNNTLRISFLSVFLYVTLLSFQPHKEWRFLAYIIPVLNVIGANGASYVTWKASKGIFYKLLILVILASTSLTAIITIGWAMISSYNYPGGYALNKFHDILIQKTLNPVSGFNMSKPITVHFDTKAAMTGITKFGELSEVSGFNITYDKSEGDALVPALWETFDYIISEINVDEYKGDGDIPVLKNWRWAKLGVIEGYAGIDMQGFQRLIPEEVVYNIFLQKSLRPIAFAVKPFVKLEKSLFVYERVPFVKTQLVDDEVGIVEDIYESIQETHEPIAESVHVEPVEEPIEEPLADEISEETEVADATPRPIPEHDEVKAVEDIPEPVEEIHEPIEESIPVEEPVEEIYEETEVPEPTTEPIPEHDEL